MSLKRNTILWSALLAGVVAAPLSMGQTAEVLTDWQNCQRLRVNVGSAERQLRRIGRPSRYRPTRNTPLEDD